uniref:Transcription factor PIF1 n=1 Tax=Anthurium amnicola TaxID=1678845 RepID=A0A1D1XJQ0_9ARAE
MFTIPTPSLFPTSSSFPVSRFVTEGESRARAMNCCVPEFALEDDSSIFPSSSSFVRRIPDSAREDIVELLWQHGPVFRRRSPLVSPHGDTSLLPSCTDTSVSGATSDSVATTTTAVAPADLFMEEDEMASWLNYPLGDDDFTGGFGGVGANYFPEKAQAGAAVVPPDRSCQLPKADRRAGVGGWAASARTPLPPETRGKVALFPASRASTVVDSSVTPGRAPLESMVSSGGGGERGLTSSSGVVGQGEAATKAAARPDDRKRKATEADDSDSHSEDDAEFESTGKRRDPRRSTSSKRPRAAEVHNLSERVSHFGPPVSSELRLHNF